MSRSSATVIDLTEESPPAHARSRPSGIGIDTHISDWAPGSHIHHHHGLHGLARDTSSLAGLRTSRPAAEPIVVGSDDEDDDADASFTITGQSEPVRSSFPLQRSFSLGTTGSNGRPPGSGPSTGGRSMLRFHEGIGRGPHGSASRIPQSLGVLSSHSSARHPLLPQRRAAIPSTSTTTARRSGASSAASSDSSFISRLGGGFATGDFGFGTSYSMELLGSLISRLQSSTSHTGHTPQQSAERKVPQQFDPKWTHPHEVQPGFTHSIIEPPVEIDSYFDDKAVVTGPLPDTTPICAGCRHALVTGASGDRRIWVLPCGHVIDGRCIDKFSGIAPPPDEDLEQSRSKGKGKAKAVEPPEDEPPAKAARTSRRRASVSSAKPTPPKKPAKPKRFECPVQGCGQKCTKESGGKFSAWEVFV